VSVELRMCKYTYSQRRTGGRREANKCLVKSHTQRASTTTESIHYAGLISDLFLPTYSLGMYSGATERSTNSTHLWWQ
jgi:hypothetical protein